MIKIRCFGIVKDIVGSETTSVSYPSITVASLKEKLNTSYPEMSTLASYMIAVNQAYATDDTTITATDEVAIIPPVSGG